MSLTLHDNIHWSAGTPHPEARPAIDHAVRTSWAEAMHGMLRHADARGGRFSAKCTVDATEMRIRVQRHGSGPAISAIWSVGADERVVAASVLLGGASGGDDAAAVAAVGNHDCFHRFGESDFARLSAEPRPCLATLYLDARWYDNARVELAATALALAALFGPTCRLTVRQAPRRDQAPRAPGIDFARPRLRLVMEMVAKKARAALDGMPGNHFRIYPPREFLDDGSVLWGNGIFDKLSDTTWTVRWYDGRHDRLGFGEFLGFVHQVVEIEKAFHTAVQRAASGASPHHNGSVWTPERSAKRVPVKVNGSLDTREIVRDSTIRRLFEAVVLESSVNPPVECDRLR